MINRSEKRFEIYPIFLWVGCFSIFSSTLYYLVYAILSLFILFLSIDGSTSFSLKTIFKNLWAHKKQLSIIAGITILLFIFFPRFHSFLPTANINTQGKVGYSKDVNNSTISNLLQSNQIAFYALLSKKLRPENLYWRGRVHNFTDGYNWKKTKLPPTRPIKLGKSSKRITYDLKFEQDFDGDIILLDSPINAKSKGLGIYSINQTFEYKSYIKKKKASVQGVSDLDKNYRINLTEKQKEIYTQTPGFSPNELTNIVSNINSNDPQNILNEIRLYLLREKYSYTLSPGSIPTLKSFITAKKGYCSHYASLTALILRKKKIPARLVSGFLGGKFNDIGQFYEINSNDAHVWVEYFDNNKWNRVDPTSFIAPDRVTLGGNPESLGAQVDQGKANIILQNYYRLKLYIETLNYQVSAFLDEYDRGKQRELSKAFKVRLKYFFFIGFGFIATCLFIYYIYANRQNKDILHPADKYLLNLQKFIFKNQITLTNKKTIDQLSRALEGFPNEELISNFIKSYEKARYSKSIDLTELDKCYQALKSSKFDLNAISQKNN